MRTARASVLITLAGLALAVSGCSSSSGGTTTAQDAPAAASTTAAPTTAAAPKEDAGNNDRLASRLCTAVSRKTGELEKADAGPIGAEAQIAIELSNVYGDNVDQMDGGKIDSMLKETCPDVRAEALKVMKKDSFDQLS